MVSRRSTEGLSDLLVAVKGHYWYVHFSRGRKTSSLINGFAWANPFHWLFPYDLRAKPCHVVDFTAACFLGNQQEANSSSSPARSDVCGIRVVAVHRTHKNFFRSQAFSKKETAVRLAIARQRNKRVFRGQPGIPVRLPPLRSLRSKFPS